MAFVAIGYFDPPTAAMFQNGPHGRDLPRQHEGQPAQSIYGFVDFGSGGTKRLVLRYAPRVKL